MPRNRLAISMHSLFLFLTVLLHITLAKHQPIDNVTLTNPEQPTFFDIGNSKEIILAWWKKNTVPKPLQCNNKISSTETKKYDSRLTAPKTEAFTCKVNTTSPIYYFKGSITNGYLEGKGILLYLSKPEWDKLPKQKRKEIKENNVCLSTAYPVHKQMVKEVIGTFKKGKLHGTSRITFTDYSFSVGSYRNGKVHGYYRSFDRNGSLISAGVFAKGWKIGYHWEHVSDHLLYEDKSIFANEIKPTLVFPFLDDGTLGDPVAGDYFPNSGALENIKTFRVINITSRSTFDCVLTIHSAILEKTNYTYSIHSKSKFPLYGNQHHKLLCDIIPNNTNQSPSSKLRSWFNAIDDKLQQKKLFSYGDSISNGHEVLWQLRPELQEPDINISTMLIYDILLISKNKTITARILGSPPVEIIFTTGDVKLDNNNKLHGFNDISIVKKYHQFIPQDNALGWSPVRISGAFIHGDLNGHILVETNVSTHGWMTAKNGILHGPSVIYGISHILEPQKLIRATFTYAQKGTGFIGYYKNAKAYGNFWVGMFGGFPYGHLHGTLLATNGTITGDNISYIYPDMDTVLLGKFDDRIMKDTQESTVLGVMCDNNGLLYVSRYAAAKPSSPHFYYEPPSNVSYGAGPPGVLDPYEKKWLELKKSDNPKIGEGIFMKKDVERGVMVSSYNGFTFSIFNEELEIYNKRCSMNSTKTDDERRHCTKYSQGIPARDAEINIPPEYDQADSFLPSFGPKVNHDFRKSNCWFRAIEHPRWGAIQGIQVTKNVKTGEELLADYGYAELFDMPYDFPWYWELKRKVEKEERLAKHHYRIKQEKMVL